MIRTITGVWLWTVMGAYAWGEGHRMAVLTLAPAHFKPTAATQPAWLVTTTNAMLNGMAAPNGTPTVAWFEWGPDTNYGLTTSAKDVGNGLLVVRVSATIDGLMPSTIYHYRLAVSNEVGVAYGLDTLLATGLKVASWGVTPSVPRAASNAVAVAVGQRHSMALKPDGTIAVWSAIGGAVTNVPPGLANVVAMAGGSSFCLVVKSNGTVAAWGKDRFSQPVSVPSGLSNVIAVAGGDAHCLALKRDGTVFSWSASPYGPTNVPTGLKNVVAIQAGVDHSLALRVDGTVVAWGGSMFSATFTPKDLTNVVAIAANGFLSLALRANGTVVAWNSNTGQLPFNTPASFELSNVVAMAAGMTFALTLQCDGTVVPWGSNIVSSTTILPAGLTKVAGIACGLDHCLALAPNVPPQPSTRTWPVAMNGDRMVLAPCSDPNGDTLTYRIGSLPERGNLYQYDGSGRAEPILASNTVVTDPQGRVVFAPLAGESGLSYTSFTMVANDGEYDSVPAVVTLNAIPPPQWQPSASGHAPDGTFNLSYSGYTNVNHSVWVSTDLLDWTRLGMTSEASPGQFRYLDTNAVHFPLRFYQLRLP